MNKAKTLLAPALVCWLVLTASAGMLLAEPQGPDSDPRPPEPYAAGLDDEGGEWNGPFGHRRHGRPGVGPMGRGGPLPALERLDLSEDQREQIRGVFEQEREQAEGLREQMRSLRAELEEQIETDPLDENAIRAKAEAVGSLGAEMAVLRARQIGQVRELLTSEQLGELEELRAKREAFREQRRERFGPRRGPRAGS